ncbi:50S ribosomal protein L35 [Patescibacteria group bacterium]
MKHKTRSSAKKRIKVKKSGTVMITKSCKNHLLSQKTKRQKKLFPGGKAVDPTKMKAIRRVLPGQISVK